MSFVEYFLIPGLYKNSVDSLGIGIRNSTNSFLDSELKSIRIDHETKVEGFFNHSTISNEKFVRVKIKDPINDKKELVLQVDASMIKGIKTNYNGSELLESKVFINYCQ